MDYERNETMPYTRNPFDIPVDGVDERYMNLALLKKAFDRATISDPETALRIGEEMRKSHYIPGMIAYAHFLYSTVDVSMPRTDRYQTAERILIRLSNYLDISIQMESALAVELAGLYSVLNRPVACLAALMRAKRLGAEIAEYDIDKCRKKVLSMDVNRMGDNPHDAFDLAFELDLLGARKLTELFYQLAAETDDVRLKGKASLALADFYEKYSHEDRIFCSESRRYYQIAEDCGFPDVMAW